MAGAPHARTGSADPPRTFPFAQDGRAALSYAAAQGHTGVVQVLLAAAPGSAAWQDIRGGRPLIHACSERGNGDVVALLLAAHPQAATTPAAVGNVLPLHLAIINGAPVAVVEALLRVAPEAALARCEGEQGDENMLPLHFVQKETPVEAVAALLRASPQAAEAIDGNGNLPLSTASTNAAATESLRLIHAAFPTAAAAARGPPSGVLPLHLAVYSSSSLESVKFLLEANPAAAETATTSGSLPLHFVSKDTLVGVAKLLLEINPGAAGTRNSMGVLPLHAAMFRHCTGAIVRELVEAHPEAAKAGDSDRDLALHCSRASSEEDAVLPLLRANADAAFARNAKGQTPLHAAIVGVASSCGHGTEGGLLAIVRANPAAAAERGDDGSLRAEELLSSFTGRRIAWRALRPLPADASSELRARRDASVVLMHALVIGAPDKVVSSHLVR